MLKKNIEGIERLNPISCAFANRNIETTIHETASSFDYIIEIEVCSLDDPEFYHFRATINDLEQMKEVINKILG